MPRKKQKTWWKTVSAFTILIFSFQQILTAAPPEWQSSGSGYQPVKSISDSSENLPSPNSLPQGKGRRGLGEGETQDFLEQTLTLIPVTEEEVPHPTLSLRERDSSAVSSPNDFIGDPENSGELDARFRPRRGIPPTGDRNDKRDNHYDYDRYSFENAIEQFRPEYATAVIVENLTEENLKALTALEFEVGIAVVEGEIVLFSSGNKDEILLNAPAQAILEKADLIAHTHPHGENAGPSRFDLEHAGEHTEYVITEKQIYGYSNKDSEIRQSELSWREFIAAVEKASDGKTEQSNVEARSILNVFIREMDEVNTLSETEKLKFRSDENITLNATGMIKPATGWWQPAEGGYVMLWSGVALESDIQVAQDGVYEIEITANANDVTNILPQLAFRVDGDVVGDSVSVSNNNWNPKSYQAGRVDLTAGQHRLALHYANDNNERDVFVYQIILRKVAELPAVRLEVDATTMIKPATGWWQASTGGYVMLWSGVALESDIQAPEAGVYEIEVIANANAVEGVLPEVQLKVDGDIVGDNVAVSNNNWNPKRYSAGTVDLTAGQHHLALQYTNDNHERDVFIYQIRLRKVAELPAARVELDATAMTKPSWGWWQPQTGGYVMLWGGVGLESDIQIQADGVYEMEIIANANAVTGVLPEVQMKVNGRVAGDTVSVSNNYWNPKRYSAGLVDLTAGQHHLALQFTNDTNERDVFIYQIRLRKVAELPARVSVDAVSMTKPSWGWWQPQTGGFVMLWGGVGLSNSIQLEEDGLYEVEVIGNGNVVTGTLPEIGVKVDGRLASDLVAVTNNNWNPKKYKTGRVALKAGQHQLEVQFTNDTSERDVFIYEVRLRKVGEISERVEVEAESMTLPSTGIWIPPAGNFVTLWAGGSLNQDVQVTESGEYEIEVWGSGSVISGELPEVGVKIDGQDAGQTVRLGNNSWNIKGYSAGTVQLEAGSHALSVSFLNDSAERDATIDRVVLRKKDKPSIESLEDGTKIYREGQLVFREITPEGDEILYGLDGRVQVFRYVNGNEIRYSNDAQRTIELRSANGTLLETVNRPTAPQLNLENALKVSLENGLEAYYMNGSAVEFRAQNGIRITNFALNADQNITDALLTYPDGTREIIRDGAFLRRIAADGSVTDYTPQKFTVREIFQDHTDEYIYQKISQTQISGLKIQSTAGGFSEYDELGILRKVSNGQGKFYEYIRAQNEAGFTTQLNTAVSSVPEEKTLVGGKYDAQGGVKELSLNNGHSVEFENGRLKKVTDAQGVEVTYSYSTDAFSGLQVTRGTTTFTYNADGFLETLTTDDGTINRRLTDDETVQILLDEVGGNTLSDFELDAAGNIIRGIITTKEGVKQKIENGVLTGFETVDGRVYEMRGNEAVLTEWHFSDGTRVVYGGAAITEILFPDGKRLHQIGFDAQKNIQTFIEELPDGTQKTFEVISADAGTNQQSLRMTTLVTATGATVRYGNDGLAIEVVLADSSTHRVVYARDAQGQVTSITFVEENTYRTFSPEGDLIKLLDDGVSAEIENGEISKLFTRFGNIEAATFSEQGMMSGEVSFVDGVRQVIEEGVLKVVQLPGNINIIFHDGFLSDVVTPDGTFELSYNWQGGSLVEGSIRLPESMGGAEEPLIPYLLENEESVWGAWLLSNLLVDVFKNRFLIRSELETNDSLLFVNMREDSVRGNVYELNGNLQPRWDGVSTIGPYTSGYISNDIGFIHQWDSLPARTADFIDINGDGLSDRVLINSATDNFWLIQLNNGQGFDSPIQWHGVDASFYGGTLQAMEGRHPHILNDLIDVNGDGRPDRLMQKREGEKEWYVQLNNGQGFDATRILSENIQPLSQYSSQATYASEVRDDEGGKSVQELISDLVDMNGDGLLDRVVRPNIDPFDRWFVQLNNGDGFDDAVLWRGVDAGFNGDKKMAASLSFYETAYNPKINEASISSEEAVFILNNYYVDWYQNLNQNGPHTLEALVQLRDFLWKTVFSSMIGDQSKLIDMNGDGKADRVLTRLDANDSLDWYVQLNNGQGFNEPILWDDSLRILPDAPTAKMGSSISVFQGWEPYRRLMVDLVDVTGDGLPDRVSVAQNNNQPYSSWWVEVNTGSTFADAEEWTGIYGSTAQLSSIGQEDENFRSWGGVLRSPRRLGVVSKLQDINGDGINDRLIFESGATEWKIQFGTGTGFLPVEDVLVNALSAEISETESSRYDYLHVSLKAAENLPVEAGRVKVSLGNPAQTDSYQEWFIDNLTTDWKDLYLKIDQTKSNAPSVKIEFIPASGANAIAIYADNVTFTDFRPNAAKDWLNRMLTEENVISEIHSDRTQTLASYLGLSKAEGATAFDWARLLNAETKIRFTEAGEADRFETFYGSVSKIENGNITETTLPDGSRVTFETSAQNPNQTTQTITGTDGGTQAIELSYGRVRQVSRAGKSPLRYSYEFSTNGKEVTVVYDPDTHTTERYIETVINGQKQTQLTSRTQENGVVTVFTYNNNGALIRSEIVYKGQVHQTFEHGLTSSGTTTLTTEHGVIEEYNSQGVILFHTTPEGYRYEHSFGRAKKVVTTIQAETVTFADGTTRTFNVPVSVQVDDPTGEVIHQIVLVGYEKPETAENAVYKNGELKSLSLPGSSAARLAFNRFELLDVTDPETEEVTAVKNLLDASVFHPDGTVTEFRNGKPFAVISATGNVLSLAAENGNLINGNESAVFHYAQALKLWDDLVKTKWTEFQAPGTLPVLMEYGKENGKLHVREFAEGVVELYNAGKIDQVLSPDGEILIQYTYDSEGNPTRIEMGGARRRLESAVVKLKAEIAVEREKALAGVADREAVLNHTIEGQYVAARDRLLAIRAKIESERNKVANISVKGKKGRAAIGDAIIQVQAGLDQVNSALAQLANERANALAQLSQQVAEANAQIETQATEAYEEIELENQKARSAILKQEVSPVIYHWYRKILGRDPSTLEYERWIAATNYESGSFDLTALKTDLNGSDELIARTAQVNAIKTSVSEKLNQYLLMSDAEKLIFAQSLGLTSGNLVALSAAEGSAILDWLNERSLHFGQSAFLALEALLYPDGTYPETHNRVLLAGDLILIDILSGVITPLENDDLVISMFAMNTYAAKHNLTLGAYTMNYAALKALYDAACGEAPDDCDFKLIAHIDGNHYIIITKVTETEVTYTDPGAGPDNALDIQKLSKEEFLQSWGVDKTNAGFGYVLSARAPPESALSAPQDSDAVPSARVLTSAQQQKIRGAFFFFIIPAIIAIVAAIISAVAAIVTTILAVIGTILAAIGSVLTSFGAFLGGVFNGILTGLQAGFGAVLKGIGLIGKGLLGAFNSLHGALLGGIQGFAGNIPWIGGTLSSFTSTSAFSGALKIGLGGYLLQGSGALLDKIGLAPKFAQTLIAGGQIAVGIALLGSGNPAGFTAGLGMIAGGTSGILNTHTNLSPTITTIIGLSAAALTGFSGIAVNTDNIGAAVDAMKLTVPYLSREFASAGLTAVGSAIGLDPRLTGLLSIPVRAAAGGFVDGLFDAQQSIFDGIKGALGDGETLRGLISVGSSLGLDALGAPSALQYFVPGLLGGLVGGGTGDSNSSTSGSSLLGRIGDFAKEIGQAVVSGAKKVGQVITSFGQSIVDGFGQAIEKVSNLIPRQIKEFFIDQGNGNLAAGVNASVSTNGDVTSSAFGNYRLTYDNATKDLEFANERLVVRARNVEFGQDNSLFTAGIEVLENFGDGINISQTFDSNGVLQEIKLNDELEILLNNNPFGKIEPLNFENATFRLKTMGSDVNGFVEFSNDNGRWIDDINIELNGSTTIADGIDFFSQISKEHSDFIDQIFGIPSAIADDTMSYQEKPSGKFALKIFVARPDGNAYGGPKIGEESGDVGHAFVSIVNAEGDQVTFGRYPPPGFFYEDPNPAEFNFDDMTRMKNILFDDARAYQATGPDDPFILADGKRGLIIDDSNHGFNVATDWFEISEAEYNQIIEYRNSEQIYNLRQDSCAGLVLDVAKIAGIDLGYSPWWYANPQDLADRIQEMQVED